MVWVHSMATMMNPKIAFERFHVTSHSFSLTSRLTGGRQYSSMTVINWSALWLRIKYFVLTLWDLLAHLHLKLIGLFCHSASQRAGMNIPLPATSPRRTPDTPLLRPFPVVTKYPQRMNELKGMCLNICVPHLVGPHAHDMQYSSRDLGTVLG